MNQDDQSPQGHLAQGPLALRMLGLALPALLVWTVVWLVYYPAIMSYDSILQWGQVLSGQYNDIHPVFHTLLIWLVTRLWASLAVVVLVQIVALALTTGWALTVCPTSPRSNWLLMAAAIILALLPVNLLVVTVWKDVPYTILFVLLTVYLIRLVQTDGAYLGRKTWPWLAIICAALALVRHNGLTVAFLTLPALLLFYPGRWRPVLAAAVLALGIWAGVRGPLYNLLGVQRDPENFYFTTMLIHHLGAHLAAGTPLQPHEEALLDQVAPVESDWHYNCYSVWETTFQSDYRGLTETVTQDRLVELFVQIAPRNPLATLRHLKCSGSMVWQIQDPYPGVFSGPYLPLGPDGLPETIAPNPFGLAPASRLPGLVQPLSDILRKTTYPNWSWLFWRPALWMYLAAIGLAVTAYLERRAKWLLLFVPVAIQSITMFLVVNTQEARYHSSVYLTCLILLVYLLAHWLNKGWRRPAG